MKRVLSFLCALTMVLTMCTFYMGETLSVAAEDSNTVPITTFEQLIAEMKNSANVGKTLVFQNDIKATEWTFGSANPETMTVTGTNGTTTVTVGVGKDNFTDGTVISDLDNIKYANTLVDGVNIDGNGRAITGMVMEKNTTDAFNFIVEVGPNSTVKNITIKNSLIAVKGAPAVRLIATTVHGKVINCKTENTVTVAVMRTDGAVDVGGLFGYLGMKGDDTGSDTLEGIYEGIQGKFAVTSAGLVDGCVSKANVFAYSNGNVIAGGVVGRLSNGGGGIIRNCANYGTITATGTMYGVGGIIGLAGLGRTSHPIGYERSLHIYNCANYGKLNTTGGSTGGIVGHLDTYWSTGGQFNMVNCYNAGTIPDASKAFIASFTAPYGGKWIHGTSVDDGGYYYGARLNGGTALNFSKSDTAPQENKFNEKSVSYNPKTVTHPETKKTVFDTFASGSFNNVGVYKAPGNNCSKKFFDTADVTTILNTASKYFEGARPWVVGDDGNPHIDFTKENAPVVIKTKDQLNELRLVYNACNEVGSDIEIKATLGADIDLNPGFTFGYDSAKKAGTVTKDGTTLYLCYGDTSAITGGETGSFYSYDSGTSTFTKVAAPAGLSAWGMFVSNGRLEKLSLVLDGAGHTISGLYINRAGYSGFAYTAWDVHFSNLTLDGLILSKQNAGGCGAFIGYANNDCSIIDCVNKVTVLAEAINTDACVGGFIGNIGLYRGSDKLYERMPNHINKIIGCTNEGVVAIASDTADKDKIGGIAGYVTNSAEIAYCTNVGSVLSSSAGKLAGIAAVEIGAPRGVGTGTTAPAYGSDTSVWSAYGGTQGNIGAPYQTVVRIYGNSNSGTVKNVRGGKVASALIYNPGWISDGAWGLASTTYKYTGPHAVLHTEAIVQYNVGIKTGNTTTAVDVEDTNNYYCYRWEDGVDLRATARNAAFRIQNNYVSTVSVNELNKQLINLYPVTAAHDYEYMMWMDYDYSNGGVPHAIKMPSRAAYEGINVTTSSKSDAVATIVVSNADALQLINETANYITEQPVTIGDQVANNLIEVHEIAAKTDIAANGTKSTTNITPSVSVTNAVNHFINTNMNGVKYDVTKFKGVRIHLGADIDFGGASWRPLYNDIPYVYSGDVTAQTGPYGFEGIFDGCGYKISNFVFTRKDGVGFFGNNNQRIENVRFANLKLDISKWSGVVAAQTKNGSITNVVVEDTCELTVGENSGAICGWQKSGLILNCENNADITATGNNIGGIVGSSYGVLSGNKNYGDITSAGNFVGGISGAANVEAQSYTTSDELVHYNSGNKNYGNISAASRVGGIYGLFKDNSTTAAITQTDSENHGNITSTGILVGGFCGQASVIGSDAAVGSISGITNTGSITGTQYVGGIAGQILNLTVSDCKNTGTITSTTARSGGIIGHLKDATVSGCENEGLVTSSAASGEAYIGGIVSYVQGTCTVRQNVNRGTVDAKKIPRAGGIVGDIAGPTLVEGNVNYGDVKADRYTGGIVVLIAHSDVVVKGNVNYGHITATNATTKSDNSGIVAGIGKFDVTICYNVNHGKIDPVAGADYSGAILGRSLFTNRTKLKADVYGNIDATGWKLVGEGNNGFVVNNYITGNKTSGCTLIGGKAVTDDQFKFGQVADIINNLNYTAENFGTRTDGSNVYPLSTDETIALSADAAALTADKFVVTPGLKADYMVQEIGVDDYPLPILAAEIIKGVAAEELTVPAGPATVAPDAPETEGTEQFIGYIDYDRNIYKAGADVDGKYLYPVSVDFYTAYGAGVRTTSPTGIRYQTLVKDNLDMLPENFVTNFGTIILPYSYVEQMMAEANAATFNKKVDVAQIIESGLKCINIENNGWADPTVTGVEVAEGYKTYMGSLVNILDNNLKKDFTGISYLKVEYADDTVGYFTANWQTAADGTEFVDGANYNKAANARSIATIADLALKDEDANFSDSVKATLQEYINKANGLLA